MGYFYLRFKKNLPNPVPLAQNRLRRGTRMPNSELSLKDELELLLTAVGANRSTEIAKLRGAGVPADKITLIEAYNYPQFTKTPEGLQVEDCFYVRQTIPEDLEIADPFKDGVLMRWEIKNPNMKCWKLGVRGGEVVDLD